MKHNHLFLSEAKAFLLLWSTQSFSELGSAITSYALVIWSYEQKGSALATSLLMICSYAPYVILSIFAGTISDRWNKKRIMLVCDTIAAMGTVTIFLLLRTGTLALWHLYILNSLNGVMNTVQQPASEVAVSRILPKKYYQKIGGMRYFSNALNSICTPILATAFLAFAGMTAVLCFDLITFGVAFITLFFFIRIPENTVPSEKKESFIPAAETGIKYLRNNRGIFDLILFLACINLTAAMYQAAFPAMLLSRTNGGQRALGTVNAVIGIAMLAGSIIASLLGKPKSRVRIICNTLLFSMSFENFILAFGRTVPVWCIGGFLGWIFIPLMNTNLDAVLREYTPLELQGRVYAVRNTLQFFTIPAGYFLGGFLVDKVFEPVMRIQRTGSVLLRLFGSEKGSGAAFFFFVIAFPGIFTCILFRCDRNLWKLEEKI
ncbi:MAG TPA: MFS transporter [Treponema sp.]|nr:MFS transporter [Treponema sp.]